MESNCCGADELMPYSGICSDCKEHAEFEEEEEEEFVSERQKNFKKKSIISGPVDPDKMLQIIETAQDMHIQNYLGTALYMKSFHNAEDVKKILSGLETFERTVSVMPTHPYYYDEDEEEVTDWDKLENQSS